MRRRKFLKRLLAFGGLLTVFIYFNNASWLAGVAGHGPHLLAHRGVAQTFPFKGIRGDTDTSKIIYPPEHGFLENTIPSMEEAFRLGAEVVEFDIHPTTDGHFAVFHDWTVDYRTDGHGVTRELTLAELKKLDVGHGYTADGGKTFPFRGKGIGMMPSLDEVLARFPDREFLIHIKSDDPEEGRKLAAVLKQLSEARRELLTVYGGNQPVATLLEELPALRVLSRERLKKGLLQYLAIGWTGHVPPACRNCQIHVPEKYAPLLWGWPHRFVKRMEAAGSRVVLVAGNGDISEGFDSLEDLNRLPEGYSGWVCTNRIDRIGPRFNAEIPRQGGSP